MKIAPDAVITDVIMPDKDGYEVCRFIKQHEQLGKTPVILMSGIVNQSVAEKATTVKADELIRKPFQPQDLVTRVKNLMNPKPAAVPEVDDGFSASPFPASRGVSDVLGDFFAPPPPVAIPVAIPIAVPMATPPVLSPALSQAPRATREPATAALPFSAPPQPPQPPPIAAAVSAPTVAPAAATSAAPSAAASQSLRVPAPQADSQKLRNEIRRLELLVKKLQAELAAGREYCAALEAHCKSMLEGE